MAWRDRLLPGSFRGVPFGMESHGATGGRRVEAARVPRTRDKPYAEDLGRRARGFSIEGWIVGENYDVTRELLIIALDMPGPGRSFTRTAASCPSTASATRRKGEHGRGGMCRVTMTFLESGQRAVPVSTADIAGALIDAAEAAADSIADQFIGAFGV